MKIVIDCRFWGLEHAGLGRYVSNLVKNIIKIDKKNKYILLATKKRYPEISSLLPKVKVIPVEVKHYSFKEQIAIPLILKKMKYDLVHFPHFNVPIFTALRKPMILTIHDLIKDESRGLEMTTRHPAIYFAKYLGYKLTMSQALKRAERIIVPSNWVKKRLVRKYKAPKDKVSVIYEGVENKFKVPWPPWPPWPLAGRLAGRPPGRQSSKFKDIAQNLKILKKYKIRKPYFIYVGSAYPHKNLRSLIFAVKLINQLAINNQQSTINLVIVSSRDVFWQRLKKQIVQARAEEYINLAGFIPDDELKVLYTQAIAFMTPSLMEGFGLPGIEAMVSGCPVIASKRAALPEIYGQAAFYFDPENLEDIKNKMVEVLELPVNKRKAVIQKGIKQANKYSWQKCALKTLKIYEEVSACFSLR